MFDGEVATDLVRAVARREPYRHSAARCFRDRPPGFRARENAGSRRAPGENDDRGSAAQPISRSSDSTCIVESLPLRKRGNVRAVRGLAPPPCGKRAWQTQCPIDRSSSIVVSTNSTDANGRRHRTRSASSTAIGIVGDRGDGFLRPRHAGIQGIRRPGRSGRAVGSSARLFHYQPQSFAGADLPDASIDSVRRAPGATWWTPGNTVILADDTSLAVAPAVSMSARGT